MDTTTHMPTTMDIMMAITMATTIMGIQMETAIVVMAQDILLDQTPNRTLETQENRTTQKVHNQLQEIRLHNQEVIQGLQTQSLELLQDQLTHNQGQLQDRQTLSLDLVRDLRTHRQNRQQDLQIKNREALLTPVHITVGVQEALIAAIHLEAAGVDHQVVAQKNQDNHEKYFINYQHIIAACFRLQSKQCRCTSL